MFIEQSSMPLQQWTQNLQDRSWFRGKLFVSVSLKTNGFQKGRINSTSFHPVTIRLEREPDSVEHNCQLAV